MSNRQGPLLRRDKVLQIVCVGALGDSLCESF